MLLMIPIVVLIQVHLIALLVHLKLRLNLKFNQLTIINCKIYLTDQDLLIYLILNHY